MGGLGVGTATIAYTAVKVWGPGSTATNNTQLGADLNSSPGLPSWPLELSPQAHTEPSAFRATVWALPTMICGKATVRVSPAGLGVDSSTTNGAFYALVEARATILSGQYDVLVPAS